MDRTSGRRLLADLAAAQRSSPTQHLRYLAQTTSTRDLARRLGCSSAVIEEALKLSWNGMERESFDVPSNDGGDVDSRWDGTESGRFVRGYDDGDVDLFREPATDWAWYWIGFFTEKSSVTARRPILNLSRKWADQEHLQNFADGLDTTYPINGPLEKGITALEGTLSITSPDLMDNLSQFGILPGRFADCGWRVPAQLLSDKEWMRGHVFSYLRGVIDASMEATPSFGRVYISSRSRLMLDDVREILTSNGVRCSEPEHISGRNVQSEQIILFRTGWDPAPLAELLYNRPETTGATVWLERQRDVFRRLLANRGTLPTWLTCSMPDARDAALGEVDKRVNRAAKAGKPSAHENVRPKAELEAEARDLLLGIRKVGDSPTAHLRRLRASGMDESAIAKELGAADSGVVATALHFSDAYRSARRGPEPTYDPGDVGLLRDPRSDWAWYWVGFLSGRSSISTRRPNQIHLAVRSADTPHVINLLGGLEAEYAVGAYGQLHGGKRVPFSALGITSRDLADSLAQFGLLPGHRRDRAWRIPQELVSDPGWMAGPVFSYLRGLFDVEADIAPDFKTPYSSSCRFSSASGPLVSDVREILMGAGVDCGEICTRSHVRWPTRTDVGIAGTPANLERLAEVVWREPRPDGPTVWLERQRDRMRSLLDLKGATVRAFMHAPMPAPRRAALRTDPSFGKSPLHMPPLAI